MRVLTIVGLITAAAALTGCDRSEPSAAPTQEGAPEVYESPALSNATRPEPMRVSVDGREVVAPAGSSVKFKTTTTRGANGVGAGINTDNAETAAGFNAGAPVTNLAGELGGGADGGLSSANFKMRMPPGTSPLLWVGVACLLGAGACLYLGLRRAATFAGLFGLLFLGASALPGIALFLVCGAAVLLGGAYLYAEHKGRGTREALRGVLAGVEAIPDAPTRIGVKSFIKGHIEDPDRAVISAIKKADGLPSER